MRRYIRLPHAVLEQYELTSSELMLYVALLKHCNLLGCCKARHSTLAAMLGVSERTVSATIAKLEGKGLVHITKRISRGRQISNRYDVVVPRGRFVKIPANIFELGLGKSTFKVYVHLLKCKGNSKLEAFPSLNQMVAALHMSKRTIVDAIAALSSCVLLHKRSYNRKTDRRIGHNRYLLILPSLRAMLLSLVCLFKKGQKKIRATPTVRVTRTNKKTHENLSYNISRLGGIVNHHLHGTIRLLFIRVVLFLPP